MKTKADGRDTSHVLCIVMINWNKWKDTIECLESLKNSEFKDFTVVLIDNGSVNDSVGRIKEWLIQHGSRFQYVLFENRSNIGFACGSNIGIAYALEKGFKYIMLLNNDTIVDSAALARLIDTMENNFVWDVLTPQIRYYDDPGRIANSGGRLTVFGHRKYYDLDRHERAGRDRSVRSVTFLTGCALLSRTGIYEKFGLLSTNFFFGEEDYDFCLKMKKNRIKMACVRDAVVFHKIGATKKDAFPNIRSVFLHYLNRFVNFKYYYHHAYWHVWRVVSFLYIVPMIYFRYHYPIRSIFNMMRLLIKYSNSCRVVSKEFMDKAFGELTRCC